MNVILHLNVPKLSSSRISAFPLAVTAGRRLHRQLPSINYTQQVLGHPVPLYSPVDSTRLLLFGQRWYYSMDIVPLNLQKFKPLFSMLDPDLEKRVAGSDAHAFVWGFCSHGRSQLLLDQNVHTALHDSYPWD